MLNVIRLRELRKTRQDGLITLHWEPSQWQSSPGCAAQAIAAMVLMLPRFHCQTICISDKWLRKIGVWVESRALAMSLSIPVRFKSLASASEPFRPKVPVIERHLFTKTFYQYVSGEVDRSSILSQDRKATSSNAPPVLYREPLGYQKVMGFSEQTDRNVETGQSARLGLSTSTAWYGLHFSVRSVERCPCQAIVLIFRILIAGGFDTSLVDRPSR
jgi:hypothetical protein